MKLILPAVLLALAACTETPGQAAAVPAPVPAVTATKAPAVNPGAAKTGAVKGSTVQKRGNVTVIVGSLT